MIGAIDERLEADIIIGIGAGATSEAGVIPILNISTLAIVTTDYTRAPSVHKDQCTYRLHQTNEWAGRRFRAAGIVAILLIASALIIYDG